jgi:hypothetical protein
MKSMNNLARVGPRRVFQQGNFIGVAADERVWRDPLERRALLRVFIDAVLIQRHRHRELAC